MSTLTGVHDFEKLFYIAMAGLTFTTTILISIVIIAISSELGRISKK